MGNEIGNEIVEKMPQELPKTSSKLFKVHNYIVVECPLTGIAIMKIYDGCSITLMDNFMQIMNHAFALVFLMCFVDFKQFRQCFGQFLGHFFNNFISDFITH